MQMPEAPSTPLTHKLILVVLCGILALQAATLWQNRYRSKDSAAANSNHSGERVPAPAVDHEPASLPSPQSDRGSGTIGNKRPPAPAIAARSPSAVATPSSEPQLPDVASSYVRVERAIVPGTQTNASGSPRIAPTLLSLPAGTNHGLIGKVVFQGTPPPVKALPDGLRCGGQPFTGPLPKRFEIGAEGGLADVVVYVTAGPSIDQKAFVVPPAPVVVKISNCLYHPYVFGVRVGQSIRFHNGGSDPEVIRIPSASGGGVRELQRLLRPDQTVDIVLTQPAAHRRIQSETDRWRVAYVSAFEHPWFSVTDTNGNYWLPALAPGEHWICAQHREKKLLQVVKIDPQQSPQVLDFAFGEGAAPQETSIKNPAE